MISRRLTVHDRNFDHFRATLLEEFGEKVRVRALACQRWVRPRWRVTCGTSLGSTCCGFCAGHRSAVRGAGV